MFIIKLSQKAKPVARRGPKATGLEEIAGLPGRRQYGFFAMALPRHHYFASWKQGAALAERPGFFTRWSQLVHLLSMQLTALLSLRLVCLVGVAINRVGPFCISGLGPNNASTGTPGLRNR